MVAKPDLPQIDVAEITLIGTGGGYGESCVIHAGENNWIVVDSCIDPMTKKCLPLEYLQSINVDVASQVKLIICTHWHDDHILGLSKLFEVAESAFLAMANAHDRKKFLQLISLDYEKIRHESSNSSSIEFNRCLELAIKRKKQTIWASQDKTLWTNNKLNASIVALSPSDYSLEEFNKEIGSLITEYGQRNKKIIPKSPNSKSVVTFIKLGEHRAILGADLETTNNANEGWLNILDNSRTIDKKSSLFKISHHGSRTGYHERIWLELLEPSTIAKITPWNRKDKLPEPEMLQIYCGHTNKVYMTSPIISSKPKKREKGLEKFIKSLNCKLSELKYNKGVIRCRINISSSEAIWNVELIDNAFHVNEVLSS